MPNPTPAERFGAFILNLSQAVVARHWFGAGLSNQLIALINDRLLGIVQRVRRIAARVAAGPRSAGPLPRGPGWLRPLLADTSAYASQLEALPRDPEMAALLAAAPTSLARPPRSLRRMLGATPPAILAPPPRTPRPPPRRTARPGPPSPPPSRATPAPTRPPPTRARGSPFPA